ncbi:MAG TPA: DUF2795 domain-containing protein [Thermodesulfobacteriota bacterium]|nr:DUF2795 domain-containing protein [Thermodesulfobacteriota bacterium]HOC38542.1 DUF2795 domain-containing protein [Thermodesulfobacteriota bacterium]
MIKEVRGASSASIEHYLKGLHFPAGRQKILSHVRQSQSAGAAEASKLLQQLDDKDYESEAEVLEKIETID